MNRINRINRWLFAAVFFMCLIFAVPASANPDRVVDQADLLSDSEEKALRSRLDEISERQQVDVVVVTMPSIAGYTPMEFADDFYDYCGYGFGSEHDGVLLLVAMESRDYWMSTTGYGIKAFTDKGISYIEDKFVGYLSDGEYSKAFDTYAKLCDEFITQAKTGRAYDVGHMPRGKFKALLSIGISLVIGLIAAIITAECIRSQLKSVKRQLSATSYMKKGSLNITQRSDIYLYNNITRVAIPKDNDSGGGSSTHVSSSGTSHGGGGGKF